MVHALDVLAERVVRDGRVAVLYSPGYGAGWSTWADPELAEKLLFDPEVVAWVESGRQGPMPNLEQKYGVLMENFYGGGSEELSICWVPLGVRFRIKEYDGSESVILESEEQWFSA